MFTAGFTVTVHRVTRDQFDDEIGQSTHDIPGCALIRHDSSEDRDGRHQVAETGTLAGPAGADITATDYLTLPDGSRWHVDGRPRVPENPLTGWEPALSVPVKRVTG